MYDDAYPACQETYATFRIFHDDLDPEDITRRLGLNPSRSQRRGAPQPGKAARSRGAVYRTGGWFLSSEGQVESRDVRRHVDWLLDRLSPCQLQLKRLHAEDYAMDIFCFWVSASGHGGPILGLPQIERLARLRLEIGFDIYFSVPV